MINQNNGPCCSQENTWQPVDYNSQQLYPSSNMAFSQIIGGPLAPGLNGMVWFTDAAGGVNVYVTVNGLPNYRPAGNGMPQVGPHGFHIHEYGDCSPGTAEDPFPGTGGHWNPTNQLHGNHAGDFPVLFSNRGQAVMWFFADKFKVQNIIGKSVVIHQSPDDYRTQPAGASGKKLGCGVIRPYGYF